MFASCFSDIEKYIFYLLGRLNSFLGSAKLSVTSVVITAKYLNVILNQPLALSDRRESNGGMKWSEESQLPRKIENPLAPRIKRPPRNYKQPRRLVY